MCCCCGASACRLGGVLCSLAGDLKVTEVVDAPNWIVGCFMPDAVFTNEEVGG